MPPGLNATGSPAPGGGPSAAKLVAELTLSNTPRNVVIRSRVLMHRTAQGTVRATIPRELVPVSVNAAVEKQNDGEAATSHGRCTRTTQYVGDTSQPLPIELVAPQSVPRVQQASRVGGDIARGRTYTSSSKGGEDGGARYDLPPLTLEIRTELKQHLDNLVSVCRADFKAHPRSARFFTRELWEVCQLLRVPHADRQYRKQRLSAPLAHFVSLLPDLLTSDLAPSEAELCDGSFLTLTIMLSIVNIPWEFRFNGTKHRICNCLASFGSPSCLMPLDGTKAKEFQAPAAPAHSKEMKSPKRYGGGATALPSSMSTHSKMAAAEMGSASGPGAITNQSGAAVSRRHERHFPMRLQDVSSALKDRFLEFASQVPAIMEDLMALPEPSEQGTRSRQAWDKWASHVISEISVLDRYYTQFEQLYMGLVSKLIQTTLEPVTSLAGPSESLIKAAGDPFREVEISVFCQRLGLLKQQVDFGGRYQLVQFDSALLEKARRVLQVEIYPEVQQLARDLLDSFKVLCRVLSDLQDDQIKPHLRENPELKEAVLKLEEAWAQCQYVLHQGSLDFLTDLLAILPQLPPMLRWHMRIALQGSRRPGKDMVEVDPRELTAARVALYQTVPMVVYLDEVWQGIDLHTHGRQKPQTPSISQLSPDRPRPRFLELFCAKDDRHQLLAKDLGKWDPDRFRRFRSFLIAGSDGSDYEGDERNKEVFNLVYKQLQAVSSFPVHDDPTDAITAACRDQGKWKAAAGAGDGPDEKSEMRKRQELVEGAARWVCLLSLVQAVDPQLFPQSHPAAADRASSREGRRGSAVRSGRRQSVSISVASPPLKEVL